MTFNEKLRRLREERDMMQKELAEKLGCSPKTISGYERGEREPNLTTLNKLAEIFGVTADYLISDGVELEEEFPEGVQVLRRATKELTPEARAKMIKLMKAFLEKD